MNKFKKRISALLCNNDFLSATLVALTVAAVIFVNIIMYTLANRFNWYFTPEEKLDFSISDSGETLFADAMDKGLTVDITFCMYEEDLKELALQNEPGGYVYKTAKEYEKKYSDFLNISYVNAITLLDSEGNSLEDSDNELYNIIVNKKDMRQKDVSINKTSLIFRCGSNYYILTDDYTNIGFADFFTLDSNASITSYEGEEVFASMISWVLKDNHGTAYLTTGHGETANVSLRYTLIRAGYYCDAVSDIHNLRDGYVPADADLLIISNPRADFERAVEGSESEIERLRAYVNGGGRLMVFLDSEASRLPILESFIAEYGISIMDNGEGERLTIKDSSNAITADGFTLVAEYNKDSSVAEKMQEKTESLGGRVILKSVSPLSLKNGATAILTSSSSSVAEAGGETVDREGSYPIAACATKENSLGRDGKIFVVSSIYLTAADAMITDGYSNKDFLYSLFDVYFEKGAMPYGCNSLLFSSGILENLTMGTAKWMTAALIAVPVIIGLFGTVVIVRRKNR